MNTQFKHLGQQRGQEGMSLATVLALGIVMTLFVSSIFAIVMPAFTKAAGLRNQNSLRAMCEAGMDYTIQSLNNSPTLTAVTVPTSLLTIPDATVSVNISNSGDPPNTSMLFDPLFTASSMTGSWRMVTVTSQVGASRTVGTTKQMRCLLQPIVAAPSSFQYGLFGVASIIYAGQSGINTYNKIKGGKVEQRTGAEGGTLGKISQIYGNGGLTRSIQQGGSHYEYPNPQSYYNQQFNIAGSVFNAQPASPGSANWMQMMGNVYSNGSNTAYLPSIPSSYTTGANVFGAYNGIDAGIPTGFSGSTFPVTGNWTGGSTAWNVQPTAANGNTTYPQPTIPPAPDAPSGTTSLGNISLSNGAKLIIDPSAPVRTTQLSSLSGSGQSVSIPPGDYRINSISLSGGSSIQVASAAQSSGATTKFYLEGNNTTAISVSNNSSINMSGISGTGFNTSGKNGVKNGTQNGAASNQLAINNPNDSSLTNNISETAGSANQLQILSNANTNIVLQGNERMLIYAPYSDITIGSTLSGGESGSPLTITNDANYYGSAAGANIYVESSYSSGGGAFMHYDWNLRAASTPEYLDPWNRTAPFGMPGVSGYRAVTWQEAVKPSTTATSNDAVWTYQ
jgi:Tfp pilus assembly protein PilX